MRLLANTPYIFIAILFVLFSSISFVEATSVIFSGQSTKYLNFSVSSAQIKDISFIVSGSNYNGSFPANVTLDIGDDGVYDWEYSVYPSSERVELNSLDFAWSDNFNNEGIYFVNLSANTEIFELTGFGKIQNGSFREISKASNGMLGITSAYPIPSQTVSLSSDRGTIHAFLPNITSATDGTIGVYVARGGSTYYCNSDHSFSFTSQCDLSVQEALTPAHLARKADILSFNFSETIWHPRIIKAINKKLSGCKLPCNISVRISSGSAGIIDLTESYIAPNLPPADIQVSDAGSAYRVSISPNDAQTATGYFYGEMPKVYVVPVVADDDSSKLSTNQSIRLTMLINTLAIAWDNLTNFSHPLNFTFYNKPYVLQNYKKGESLSRFESEIWNAMIQTLNPVEPAVVIVLDIRDYFPSRDPSNTKRAPGSSNGVISEIYINGFSDTNKTSLYQYDSQVLRNIVLHELAHTFIDYPAPDAQRFFHSNHPASFSDLPDFITFTSTQSSTGEEGYYEIYSIMNQLRPYIAKEDVGNREPQLSSIDKMFMGILSPDKESNYTFYTGSITKSGNRYSAAPFSATSSVDTSSLYKKSIDSQWWDVRSASRLFDTGTSTGFDVQKLDQANRALWIFARDSGHSKHFQVFNFGASSVQTVASNLDVSPPRIVVLSPTNAIYGICELKFAVSANEPLDTCIINISNVLISKAMTKMNDTYFFYANTSLADGNYSASFWCNDSVGNSNVTRLNSVRLDTTPPKRGATNLRSQFVSMDSIYWTWETNESDFSAALLYFNGINIVNTTATSYNSTGLAADTPYFFAVYTKDSVGNVNFSAAIATARTAASPRANCSLSSALWNNSTTTEGQSVQMVVTGNNCDGRRVNFTIWEKDSLNADDSVQVNPASTSFIGGVVNATWVAEFQPDEFYSLPEYYFIAIMSDGSSSIQSGTKASEMLSVSSKAVQNQPPVINALNNQSIILPNSVQLIARVTDDDLPVGGALFYSWSAVSGPGTVFFVNSSNLTTSATFSINGTYILRITANDSQLTASGDMQITVVPVADTTPPVISQLMNTSITQSSAVISWLTDDLSDSVVYYGISPSLGLRATGAGNVNSHSTTLTGLTANTIYYYKASSANTDGKQSNSSVFTFRTLAVADTTPPIITGGLPSGVLAAGTASVILSSTTNEAATCKYTTTANTPYDSMANTFLTTGGTSHSTTISGLANGQAYNYYVRCKDSAENANTNDYLISFSVANASAQENNTINVQIGNNTFAVATSGEYVLTGLVKAPGEGANSFYIDINQDPSNNESKIWDLSVTSVFQNQNVSWRGPLGNFTYSQFNPKIFSLTTGTHNLYIRIRESGSEIQTMTFVLQGSSAENQPPEVSLSLDLLGIEAMMPNFTAPATFKLSVNALDRDGVVQKVEFYEGARILSTDTNSSDGWIYVWRNVSAGTYSLTVRATDDKGASTTTFPLTVNVVSAFALTCTGAEPTGEGVIKGPFTYSAGASITNWTYDNKADTTTACLWKCNTKLGYKPAGNKCVYRSRLKGTDITTTLAGSTFVAEDDANNQTLFTIENTDQSSVNISNIEIERHNLNESTAYLIIKNLTIPPGKTKAAYIKPLNAGANAVCIADRENIQDVNDVLANCLQLRCPGNENDYSCEVSGSEFIVRGLKHSGLVEQTIAEQQPSGGGTSTGSGGGGSSLVPQGGNTTQFNASVQAVQQSGKDSEQKLTAKEQEDSQQTKEAEKEKEEVISPRMEEAAWFIFISLIVIAFAAVIILTIRIIRKWRRTP